MITESFYVLKRTTVNPYLDKTGLTFSKTLENAMRFQSMADTVIYLRKYSPSDVVQIVRVDAVVEYQERVLE